MPYHFPISFYVKQYTLLFFSAVALLILSKYTPIDHWLTHLYFDETLKQFPLKHNFWLTTINHDGFKDVSILFCLVLLFLGVVKRQWHWVIIALIMASGPLVIGILKHFSHHSCPWDLIPYGGNASEYPLLGTVISHAGRGQCFPGGHASGGFALMGLFFLFYPSSPRYARWAIWLAIVIGNIMGWGQLMRGAHFLSHNLWTMWWVWLTEMVLYQLYDSVNHSLIGRNTARLSKRQPL